MRIPTDAMTAADVARLMMRLPDSRARAIAALDVYEGLRTGEIARLHVADYNGTTLVVIGENGSRRDVLLGDLARRSLDVWLEQRDENVPQIFPGATTWSISDEIVGWMTTQRRRMASPTSFR